MANQIGIPKPIINIPIEEDRDTRRVETYKDVGTLSSQGIYHGDKIVIPKKINRKK